MTASTGELQAEHVDDCAPRPAQILLAAERPASTAASGFTQTEPSGRADSDLCTLLLAVYGRPKQEPVIRLPERRRSRSASPSPDAGEPRPSLLVAGLDPDASFWAIARATNYSERPRSGRS